MTGRVQNVWRGLARVFTFIPDRRRWQGVAILALMVVGAFAELMTIGAILPFLALIADPHAGEKIPALQRLLGFLGLEGRGETLVGIAAIFCLVALAAGTVRIALSWASQKYIYRIGHDLGVALYERMLYQSYRFHVANNTSSIITGINKVQHVMHGMMMPLMQTITSVTIAVFIVAGLLLINAPVALVAAVLFGVIYVAISLFTRKALAANGEIISRNSTSRTQTIQEGLGAIRDIIIDQAQPVYVEKFARVDTALRNAQAANALIGSFPRFLIESLGMVLIAVLALFLVNQESGLTAALPVLGALAIGAQRLLPLLQQIYSGWTQVAGNRANFQDVLTLLENPLPPDIEGRRSVRRLRFDQSIEFRDVSFGYDDQSPPVLRNISLTVPKGARIGFIGKTGSGKSTVMDLAMGLISPVSGGIYVDGERLAEANMPSWQVQIAHVPQTIYLADRSILENIAFGVPRRLIDEARAREAARKANIEDFILEQPAGYDALVGERGVRLSGGQRQRIGVARALYKQAAVLVLDEATSALDDATEASVIHAVEQAGPELTVLMIAHRLSTLKNCDVIYTMENGALTPCERVDDSVARAVAQAAPRSVRSRQHDGPAASGPIDAPRAGDQAEAGPRPPGQGRPA